ncbi:MAG: carbonic anhydrase [Microbacteriaceae bacterium]
MTALNPVRTPAEAWQEMVRGNERFIAGAPQHPRQDVERREDLGDGQAPLAALFGCSDSRLAAEIIFDKGLGDLFVVRNAGQVLSDSAIGSLEYAVEVLAVPLIVVLGHDQCGAVQAAIASQQPDAVPLPPYIDGLVRTIVPAVRRVPEVAGYVDPQQVGREHLRDTVNQLVEVSELIGEAIAVGRLAVVGANYRLREGQVVPHIVIGSV